MTTDDSYNGYPNYETWAVALWMSNDEENHRYYRTLARVVRNQDSATSDYLPKSESDAIALAGLLKDHFEEASPVIGQSSVYADLMHAALAEVAWYTLAEGLLEEIG